MSNIYTYVDFSGFLTEVAESALNFAGDWSATAHYYRHDVVTYGFSRYVCTVANSSTTPPIATQFNSSWSIITFTSTGTGSSGTNSGGGASVQMVNDVYSLAYRAYNIALTGTDLPVPSSVPAWVMEWIGHTYNISRSGTDAANSADMWARDAFHIAVNGTNAANQVFSLARLALDTAWAGTDAANSADMWGRDAFSLAVDGTNAAAAAWSYAGQAYSIAVAGTDAANSADMWGRDAFSIAVAGTNAANSADMWGRVAYSLAQHGTISHQTLNYSGTVTLDFGGSTYQTVGLTGNVQFAATNMSDIKAITARIVCNTGSTVTMAFPASWVFVNDTPVDIEASKTGILSLTSFGNTYSDVVAAYIVQP